MVPTPFLKMVGQGFLGDSCSDAPTMLPCSFVGTLAGWLVSWLVGWLAGWLAGWLVGWVSRCQSS